MLFLMLMGKEPKRQSRRRVGKDEMNLAEFPISVVGKRAPGDAKTLHFEDEVWDRSRGANVVRRLTVTGSDYLGLPMSLDDEVLLGCVQLSKDGGFAARKVRFNRYELLERIGWRRDGPHYRRVSESLARWAGTLVISDKAYWDKKNQGWVQDSFNIIDRVLLTDREAVDGRRRSALIWGDFMWRSFEAGNLKQLDFDFWLQLKSPVAKRLYRFLDKRFHHAAKILKFDLRRLAFEKVGLSRNMHTGQIKEKLRGAHDELASHGVCRAEFVKRSRGQWDVVYEKTAQRPQREAMSGLEQQLRERGIVNARELVARHPADSIRACIANYDDRRSHGEDIGQGWLGSSIVRGGFGPRKGGASTAERRAQAKSLRTADAKETEARKAGAARVKRELDAFRRRLAELGPEEVRSRERAATERARAAGDKLLADLIEEATRKGESSIPLRRELWSKYVDDETGGE